MKFLILALLWKQDCLLLNSLLKPNNSFIFSGHIQRHMKFLELYKHMLKGIKDDMANKQNIFETEQESSLLDEKNIKDI